MPNSSTKSKTKIRILPADDHHIVRPGVRQLIESESIAEAEDGEEAQALIQQYKPDVAVLDIQMPKASGIEVTRWVHSDLPKIGVLILTAYEDDPYVEAVLQADANGYVLKTGQADELIQAVRDVQGYLVHSFTKLQANSRAEAVMRAVSSGLISQSTGNISEE